MGRRCAISTMRGSFRAPTATVTNKGPDGTLLLDADGTTVVLGADLCQRLYVAVL